jgi:hypothetical protein
MNTDERMRALLALVDEHREARRAELLGKAREEARAAVVAASRQARSRVHDAIAAERKRYEAGVSAAEAQLHTRRRLAHQAREAAMVAAGWQRLRSALGARWADPDGRRRWAATLLERALGVLPRDAWEVRHAPSWPEAERRELAARVAGRDGPAVAFVAEPSIAAGFRVRAGHNTLDATLDGLLADRKAIEGRLLHRLEQAAAS